MLTNIKGVTDYVDTTKTTSTNTAKGTLGKDDFLKLLLAQLNHQDPLNPADASQFASQLAQFSSLEQLTNVNDNLTSLKTSQESSNKFQAMGLIGKNIEADGDTLYLGDKGTATGGFTIPSAASCAVAISDENGNIINTIDMGNLEAGDHTFTWDGKDLNGNAAASGPYAFNVVAQDSSGNSVSATTKVTGLVDSVNLDDTDPTLYIGSLPISLSNVTDISQAAAN
jgi:flagellar basal-body rod modification protein FlgD